MNTSDFHAAFTSMYSTSYLMEPTPSLVSPGVAEQLDPCPKLEGMASIKKMQLLNLAFKFLKEDESYFEVGTYKGKSLVAAMRGNDPRHVFACDNFSEFQDRGNSVNELERSLSLYGLRDRVRFLNGDFREFMLPSVINERVGLYFYDGAHDEQSQYDGIKLVEPFLSDEALVIVDDWRYASDSASFARSGTMRAAQESENYWALIYELPARYNGDMEMWWNGVGVLSFMRKL